MEFKLGTLLLALLCFSVIASTDIKEGLSQSTLPQFLLDETTLTQPEVIPHDQAPVDPHQVDPHQEQHAQEESHFYTPHDRQFWQYCGIALICTITGGFCSGLTVGFNNLNKMELQMMTLKKNEEENKMAKKILTVIHDHHLYLVTLLIANAIALQSLPLIVHHIMPDWAAILFSTFIVLVMAEIVPQAYCTGPSKMKIAYYASDIVLIMIKIFWIFSYPIGKGLDYLYGVHTSQRIKHKDFATYLKEDSILRDTEKMLLTSTLELRTERVTQIMIPTKNLYMLQFSEKITPKTIQQIVRKDYSYVLVYKERKDKIVGAIKIKQFAVKYLLKEGAQSVVSQYVEPNSQLLCVYADTNLLEMLMLFQAKSTRIALVCDQKRKVDPNIQSIMYSKSDMIMKKEKQSVIIGVVFLYQLFSQMARFKNIIEERQSNVGMVMQFGLQLTQGELNKKLLNS